MKTRIIGVAVVAAVVVVAVLAVLVHNSSGSATGTTFSGQVLTPSSFSVAPYQGKPLVINFFGSWCKYCRLEAGDLARFAQQNPGAQVVGIASQDTRADAEAFMAHYGLHYPLVMDDGSLVARYGINGFPTTIFFNAQGAEVDRLVGASTFDQFTASLAKAQ